VVGCYPIPEHQYQGSSCGLGNIVRPGRAERDYLLSITILAPSPLEPLIMMISSLDWGPHGKERVIWFVEGVLFPNPRIPPHAPKGYGCGTSSKWTSCWSFGGNESRTRGSGWFLFYTVKTNRGTDTLVVHQMQSDPGFVALVLYWTKYIPMPKLSAAVAFCYLKLIFEVMDQTLQTSAQSHLQIKPRN
jgi:hypothetical protein